MNNPPPAPARFGAKGWDTLLLRSRVRQREFNFELSGVDSLHVPNSGRGAESGPTCESRCNRVQGMARTDASAGWFAKMGQSETYRWIATGKRCNFRWHVQDKGIVPAPDRDPACKRHRVQLRQV